MPRNSANRTARDRFAALLRDHVSGGTRPASAAGEPWTYASLAREVLSSRAESEANRDSDEAVSDRTIANWCRGQSLPHEIEPLLRPLFGPDRANSRHGDARETLRQAFIAAQTEKSAEIAARQKQSPAGPRWTNEPDPANPAERVLAIDRSARPTDRRAAADPIRQQMQRRLHGMASELSAAAVRLKNTVTWARLHQTALDYARLLEGEPDAVTGHLGDLYALALRLGSFLTTDDAVKADPRASADPLDHDIRGLLSPLVQVGAPWLRGFPSIAEMDDQAGKLLVRSAQVGGARNFALAALSRGVIAGRDAAELEVLAEAAQAPGFLGEKAGGRAVGGARNLLMAAGHLLAAVASDALPTDGDPSHRLTRRIAGLLEGNAGDVTALTEGLAPDIAMALRLLAREALSPDRSARPRVGVSPPREVPEDVEARAREMVLRGEAPPVEWRPFVRGLNFAGERLAEIRPLAGLTALQRLVLWRTQVSDLAPLAGLTALESLDLDGTQVSNLTPLAGLTALVTLDLLRTQVSDLAPLAELTALQSLNLQGTQVSDLAPLAGLTALESLYLQDTQVSDLAPLAGLTALQSLDLDGTQVSDLAPLAELTALQSLNLQGTQVSDLAPLAGLTALESLYLQDTQVSDLAPLAGLTALQNLVLPDTITDISVLDHLPDLDISGGGAARRSTRRRGPRPVRRPGSAP